MIPIGTSFELRQQAFSTLIVLEPEGVPAHVIFPDGPMELRAGLVDGHHRLRSLGRPDASAWGDRRSRSAGPASGG
jgi:hypothetical protein